MGPRWFDIGMTINVYTRTLPGDEAAALEKLPELSLPERQALSPMGTDEILPISYFGDGQMRQASRSITVNSDSEPSILDNEGGLSQAPTSRTR
jgi:hypothetical protein